jgi:hypothetical protein
MQETEKIDYRDISVVVQGPVFGLATDPEKKRYTYRALKSIRKILPGAKIILSTWKGSDVTNLDYDILVESDDPGVLDLGTSQPSPSNCFRQIVSSLNGLKKCDTKYAIKTRSDIVFKNNHFIKYFFDYNKLPFDARYKLLKKRVVTLTTSNPRRRFKLPFQLSDWFFFGLTEDIVNIFDIPLDRSRFRRDDHGTPIETDNFSTEQYIWTSFISKYQTVCLSHTYDLAHDNIAISERYFANNCILLTARRAGIDSLKYPGAMYAQGPIFGHAGLYTFTEYQQMLNKYTGAHLVVIPNLFEKIGFAVIYDLRPVLKKKLPRLHGFLRKMAAKHLLGPLR